MQRGDVWGIIRGEKLICTRFLSLYFAETLLQVDCSPPACSQISMCSPKSTGEEAQKWLPSFALRLLMPQQIWCQTSQIEMCNLCSTYNKFHSDKPEEKMYVSFYFIFVWVLFFPSLHWYKGAFWDKTNAGDSVVEIGWSLEYFFGLSFHLSILARDCWRDNENTVFGIDLDCTLRNGQNPRHIYGTGRTSP